MKNLLTSLVALTLLLLTTESYAQITVMKWDKYSNSELEMTEYELDKEANAVILGKEVSIRSELKNDDFVMVYRFHYRIKILNKEGLDEANIELPFYSKNRAETITNIKAQTVNLKDGKIEKIKMGRKDIFTENVDDNVSAKKFSFAGAQVGSILEYKYTLTSDYFFQLDDVYFQRDIPVK